MSKSDRNDGLLDYNLPIEVVRAQTQRMRQEMAEAGEVFMAVLERMESCARNVRECSMRSDRVMFQPFFDAIFRTPPCIRVLGSNDERQIYEVIGMDGSGFWLRRYGQANGAEFHLSVTDRQDLAPRIRREKQPEKSLRWQQQPAASSRQDNHLFDSPSSSSNESSTSSSSSSSPSSPSE